MKKNIEIKVLGKSHFLVAEDEDEATLSRTISVLQEVLEDLEEEPRAPKSSEALLLLVAFRMAAELAQSRAEMERLRGLVESIETLESLE